MVGTTQDSWMMLTRPVSASVLVHALLLALLALSVVPRALPAPPERVMVVDIVSPDQLAALRPPIAKPAVTEPELLPDLSTQSPDRLRAEPPPAIPERVAAVPAKGQQVRASDFYAAGILSDPANSELRRSFNSLASSEQLIQLCNIEALEQIGRDGAGQDGAAPDVVVGYAFGDLEVQGTTLRAEGGAYRQKGAWFRLRFECTSNADITAVASFDYTLGDSVPRSEWEEHYLTADDDWLD